LGFLWTVNAKKTKGASGPSSPVTSSIHWHYRALLWKKTKQWNLFDMSSFALFTQVYGPLPLLDIYVICTICTFFLFIYSPFLIEPRLHLPNASLPFI
jgi:hypothetical protein